MLFASGAALMAPGIGRSALALVVGDGVSVGRPVVFALGLLGGTDLRAVAPTRIALEGLRGAVYRGSGWLVPLRLLVAFALIGLPIAVLAFRAALQLSMRPGTLNRG